MKEIDYLKLINSGEAAFYMNINEAILVNKYYLKDHKAIKEGAIRDNEAVAEMIGIVSDRESGKGWRFAEWHVTEYEERMFKCSNLDTKLIGTAEFQKQLAIAYINYQIKEINNDIWRKAETIKKSKEDMGFKKKELKIALAQKEIIQHISKSPSV